jgi:hypothetical protein
MSKPPPEPALLGMVDVQLRLTGGVLVPYRPVRKGSIEVINEMITNRLSLSVTPVFGGTMHDLCCPHIYAPGVTQARDMGQLRHSLHDRTGSLF